MGIRDVRILLSTTLMCLAMALPCGVVHAEARPPKQTPSAAKWTSTSSKKCHDTLQFYFRRWDDPTEAIFPRDDKPHFVSDNLVNAHVEPDDRAPVIAKLGYGARVSVIDDKRKCASKGWLMTEHGYVRAPLLSTYKLTDKALLAKQEAATSQIERAFWALHLARQSPTRDNMGAAERLAEQARATLTTADPAPFEVPIGEYVRVDARQRAGARPCLAGGFAALPDEVSRLALGPWWVLFDDDRPAELATVNTVRSLCSPYRRSADGHVDVESMSIMFDFHPLSDKVPWPCGWHATRRPPAKWLADVKRDLLPLSTPGLPTLCAGAFDVVKAAGRKDAGLKFGDGENIYINQGYLPRAKWSSACRAGDDGSVWWAPHHPTCGSLPVFHIKKDKSVSRHDVDTRNARLDDIGDANAPWATPSQRRDDNKRLVIATAVNARRAPNASAPVVAKFGYGLDVTIVPDARATDGWVYVRSAYWGAEGFVRAEFLATKRLDDRALLAKQQAATSPAERAFWAFQRLEGDNVTAEEFDVLDARATQLAAEARTALTKYDRTRCDTFFGHCAIDAHAFTPEQRAGRGIAPLVDDIGQVSLGPWWVLTRDNAPAHLAWLKAAVVDWDDDFDCLPCDAKIDATCARHTKHSPIGCRNKGLRIVLSQESPDEQFVGASRRPPKSWFVDPFGTGDDDIEPAANSNAPLWMQSPPPPDEEPAMCDAAEATAKASKQWRPPTFRTGTTTAVAGHCIAGADGTAWWVQPWWDGTNEMGDYEPGAYVIHGFHVKGGKVVEVRKEAKAIPLLWRDLDGDGKTEGVYRCRYGMYCTDATSIVRGGMIEDVMDD